MTHRFNTLIIEDDADIAQLIASQVESLQGSYQHVGNITDAGNYLQKNKVDLILLDLSLPDGDGLDFCRQYRWQNESTPILMLTARSDEIDRVLGLELGADDYLSKPFGLAELKARIKALIRRSQRVDKTESSIIQLGKLKIDLNAHQVWHGDHSLTLTAKEFDLLSCFARAPNKVFSRSDLLEQIWGLNHDGYEHTVNSHMNRLRAKIEKNPAEPEILKTVWGVGYQLCSEALEA